MHGAPPSDLLKKRSPIAALITSANQNFENKFAMYAGLRLDPYEKQDLGPLRVRVDMIPRSS
jgi:hypothetical protein